MGAPAFQVEFAQRMAQAKAQVSQQQAMNAYSQSAMDLWRKSVVKANGYELPLNEEVENAMIAFPAVRRFMERVIPLDWCHDLYPKAYKD